MNFKIHTQEKNKINNNKSFIKIKNELILHFPLFTVNQY